MTPAEDRAHSTLLVTAEEMRRIEASAVERGATWHGLMDVAGKRVAEAMIAWYDPNSRQSVLVLSGPGNNGGDGLVVARHLAEHGWSVECLLWRRPDHEDGRLRNPLSALGIPIDLLDGSSSTDRLTKALSRCTMVVDGLLGTGLQRDIEGELAQIVQRISQSGKPVAAIDIPTGVDSDTGAIRGVAVTADITVTLGHYKYGHYLQPGGQRRGILILEDIGLNAQDSRKAAKGELLTDETVRALLPERAEDSNKGTFGKAFVVAGSINYTGAAALAVQGAMRAGTGLVTLGCPGDLLSIMAIKLTECTFMPLPSDMGALAPHSISKLLDGLNDYNSLLIGCGLGQDKQTVAFLKGIFSQQDAPVHAVARPMGFASRAPQAEEAKGDVAHLPPLVLDGDALNILAEWGDWVGVVHENSVFTPHPGEMARLLNSTVEEVQANRVGTATRAAAEWKQIVVLKGAATVIASPDGKVYVSPFSNPALATAGTGDVLAGAVAGFLAQGLSPLDAACVGVYIHGLAGEMLKDEYGLAGGLAGDLPVLLARAQNKLRNS